MELWEESVKRQLAVICSLTTWKPVWVEDKKHGWICVEQMEDAWCGKPGNFLQLRKVV